MNSTAKSFRLIYMPFSKSAALIGCRPVFMATIASMIFLQSGCVKIPDSDAAFLDRMIPVGSKESEALVQIERRGFTQGNVRSLPSTAFNTKTLRVELVTRTLEEVVQANIGFTTLIGQPRGELSCFSRSYSYLIASGDRLICWTVDDSDIITWRQAGWLGASL